MKRNRPYSSNPIVFSKHKSIVRETSWEQLTPPPKRNLSILCRRKNSFAPTPQRQITQLPKNHSTLYTLIYNTYTHKHAPWDSIHRKFSPNVTDTPPTPILGSRPYRESLWPTIRPVRPCTHTANRHSVWMDQCWFLPGDSKELLGIWVGFDPAKDRQRNGPWQGSSWRLLRTKTIVVSVLVVLFVATYVRTL